MFRLARGEGELADETALLNGGGGASPKSATRCLAGSFPTVCLCLVVVILLAFVPQITSTNSSGWPALISSEKQTTTTTTQTTSTTTSRPRTSLNNTATNWTRDTPYQLPSHAHLPIDLEHRSRRQRTVKSPSLLSSSKSKLKTSDDYDDEAAWSAVSTSAPASTDQVPSVAMVDSGLESADDEDSILRDEVEFQRRLIDQSHWPGSGSSSSSSPAAASPTGTNRTLAGQMGSGGELSAGPEPNLLAAFFSHIDKQWKFAEIVLIIVISAILNLVTIVGNIMVLISFKMDRSLQTVSNYFLLSLALADLLIGLISMPLYTLYLLLNYWPLGALMCDIWLAIDYLNSNAAVLNMLVISFDRYFSVTRPLTYRAKRTTKHAIIMISFAWLLSLTIWTPAIFTYPYYKGRTVQGTDKCEIEFVKANTYLTFVTAILAFYIPVAIMIYLYWRIWLETKKRYRDLTTLFLVSGVGAAAPSRPTRPPPSSLQAASGVLAAACPSKSLAKSLGARFTGGAHGHARAVGQSSQDRKLGSASRAGDSRVRLEPASDSRGRQRRDPVQGSDASNNEPSSVSNSSVGPRKEVAGPEVESTESGAAMKGAEASSAPVTSDRHIANQSHYDKNQQARGRVQSSCKLCPNSVSAKHHSRGVQRANCCCCYSNAPQAASTATEIDASQRQQRSQAQLKGRSSSKTGAGHCHIPTCSCNCNCSGAPPAERVAASKHHHHHHHHHHHRHHHHNQHHPRSPGGQQQVANVQEDDLEAETNPKCQTSGSKTSLYQLIADAASSSHQRSKIHPEAPEASSSCGKQLAETSDANATATRPNSVQLADEVTEVGASNRNRTDTCQSQTTASGSECLLVDVATSPIHFLPWPADSKVQTHNSIGVGVTPLATPISLPSQSPEPEDFETRIVSHGDKFTFETNDPKLVSSAAKTLDAAHHNPMAERRRSGSKQRCCKWSSQHSNQRQQLQEQQQQTAEGSRCSNQDKPSGGSVHHQGKQSQCCCADMISVHDAECRFCQPTGRPEHQLLHHNHRSHHHNHANNHHHHGHHHHHQHRHQKHQLSSGGYHHHHHHHHHHHQQHHSQHRGDCKRCLVQQKPPAQMTPEVAAAADNRNQGEGLKQEVANEQGGSLPILNALQQKQPIESGPNNGQADRPVKSGKKFSQKLTFSDILMERSNSCVTIESEQVAGGKSGGGGGSSKSKSSSRQLAANYEEQAIQNIVKRNADRLRSAFDEDSDDQDGGQAAATGRNESVQPSLNPTGRGNWLKCFALDMFRSRNRPVRYRTDNYRGYRTDDEDEENDGEERDDRRPNEEDERAFGQQIAPTTGRLHWLRSLCGLGARLLIVKQTPTSSSSSSSSKNNIEERNSFQTQQHRVDSKGEHKGVGGAGGASSQHSSTSSSKAQQCHHYHPIQPKSERKAAKTLSTLLLVFIVTWLPYNVLVLIKTLSGGEDQVPEKIWNFSYYLCYINSTINPLCYALCNAQFRRTYMRILKCKLSNEHNSTRRMVPIQSSSTWNKDLRLNSTSAADCSTNSTMSHAQHYQQHYLQQAVRTAERQRPKAIQEHDNKNISSSDSSAGYHQHNGHHRTR